MSDLDLTPEQWRMARQAGAAFTPDTEEQAAGQAVEQLALDGLGPVAGSLLMNAHTHTIGTVVSAATRRRAWVKIRHNGRVTEIPLSWIGEHWHACRPDGTLL